MCEMCTYEKRTTQECTKVIRQEKPKLDITFGLNSTSTFLTPNHLINTHTKFSYHYGTHPDNWNICTTIGFFIFSRHSFII